MLDELVNSLKGQVGNSLIEKIGLTEQQSDRSLNAAGNSVVDVLGGGDGIDLGDVLSLFSKNQNTNGADDLLGQLGNTFKSKLQGDVGLSSEKASGVRDLVLPILMSLMSDKVDGNKNALSGMLGGLAGGLLRGEGGSDRGIMDSVSKLFGK